MNIKFAETPKFQIEIQKTFVLSPKMKKWMKRRAAEIKVDILNDDLWLKGGERAY